MSHIRKKILSHQEENYNPPTAILLNRATFYELSDKGIPDLVYIKMCGIEQSIFGCKVELINNDCFKGVFVC